MTLLFTDALRTTRHMAVEGSGTELDPFKVIHVVEGPLTDAELRAAPVGVTLPAVQRTPGLLTTSTTGTIAAGSVSCSIANTGSGNGIVLGQTIEPGISLDWTAPPGETIGAIPYDGTGTTLLIQELR